MLLLFTLGNERNVAEILEEVRQYRVDGVVAAAHFSTGQIEACRARRLPIVFYNRSSDSPYVASVCCDHERGERELVDRLVRSGHRHFVLLSGPSESEVSRLRTRGAIDAIERTAGLSYELLEGDYTYGCGRARADQIAAMKRRPDAVICANDNLAMGCMDGLRHAHGLAIPRDLLVTGFDGVTAAEWGSYDLTTVRQPAERMVEAAVDMLLERIENPDLPAEARVFAGALRIAAARRARPSRRGW